MNGPLGVTTDYLGNYVLNVSQKFEGNFKLQENFNNLRERDALKHQKT